ncbi:hypothetical protein BS78_K023800 [Paspalum vaginatum]|uniref:Uncharacterized protein n=1 Tax=Paspalum vaginatum TaxID=158149 RepID=A0A9W8CG68_9POAL|nr:hypothetical protein BS78_K023800 [Paspalum vaginatum]
MLVSAADDENSGIEVKGMLYFTSRENCMIPIPLWIFLCLPQINGYIVHVKIMSLDLFSYQPWCYFGLHRCNGAINPRLHKYMSIGLLALDVPTQLELPGASKNLHVPVCSGRNWGSRPQCSFCRMTQTSTAQTFS